MQISSDLFNDHVFSFFWYEVQTNIAVFFKKALYKNDSIM